MAESPQSGTVLVADGLSDPNFVDTIAVVFLYSVQGTSLGVVVNRPLVGGAEQLTHGELKDVLAAVQPSGSSEPEEFFRIGGPMPSSPILLHRLGDTGTRVHQDLYTGGDLDVISAALLRGSARLSCLCRTCSLGTWPAGG